LLKGFAGSVEVSGSSSEMQKPSAAVGLGREQCQQRLKVSDLQELSDRGGYSLSLAWVRRPGVLAPSNKRDEMFTAPVDVCLPLAAVQQIGSFE
jgi:hypothetical protein